MWLVTKGIMPLQLEIKEQSEPYGSEDSESMSNDQWFGLKDKSLRISLSDPFLSCLQCNRMILTVMLMFASVYYFVHFAFCLSLLQNVWLY